MFQQDTNISGESKARKRKPTDLWYKRYPARFRRDTTHDHPMSFELRGAWGLLVDLFYEHGRPLPNDNGWIALQLGCDVRKWKPIRKKLEAAGKIYLGRDGLLHNKTADEVIEERTDKLSGEAVARKTRRLGRGATPATTCLGSYPGSSLGSGIGSSGDNSELPNDISRGALKLVRDTRASRVKNEDLREELLPREEEDGSSGRAAEPARRVAWPTEEPPWEPCGIVDPDPCPASLSLEDAA